MKHKTSREQIVETVLKLRAEIAEIEIRTSLMVVFPGKTEAHFQELLKSCEGCIVVVGVAFAGDAAWGALRCVQKKDAVHSFLSQAFARVLSLPPPYSLAFAFACTFAFALALSQVQILCPLPCWERFGQQNLEELS
eukprot:643674-Rhodomonas_salina.1